ncbi:hypothetical protein COU79_05625 [Candidatus Peregrinibacteria bacterium CG10_big_fil_rev_8_21_14_0_10_54_7]|nr:MAG: hypothetical protein COU79_05625 [Candidatus Peregrinibacteria bacterium CG10_big_fil_rev_8_21_14_0_10_54_7]
MQRLRIVIASAILFGFSLPHCGAGGFLLPKATAASPSVEHHRRAAYDAGYQSMHHRNHDCCDGCLTCQKDTEYVPNSKMLEPAGGASARTQESEPFLEKENAGNSFLSATGNPLYALARENSHSIVKLE